MPNFQLPTANFSPVFGAGVSISVTNVSANQALDATAAAAYKQIYVFNAGTATVFVRWGSGSQTAITADIALPSGSVQVFFKGAADNIAAITASGTATLYAIPGLGQ